MKIKNVEVDFDFLDADDIERLEKETERVKKECDLKEKQEMPMSQIIKEECKIINTFFDNVFGKGTSDKIFGNKMNLAEHIKAFEDIMKEKIEQVKELQSSFERYKPNREQRRHSYNQKRK